MANNNSAKKRIQIAERNRIQNKSYKSAMKTLVKNCLEACTSYQKNPDEEIKNTIQKSMNDAFSKIDKGVKRGVIHKNNGANKNGQIVPENWIDDIKKYKDNSSYLNQDKLERFPNGNYRSKWYQTGFDENEFCAIGIHGQNIWINPKKELTIIRMSSASDPINIKTEELMFSVFKEIGNALV